MNRYQLGIELAALLRDTEPSIKEDVVRLIVANQDYTDQVIQRMMNTIGMHAQWAYQDGRSLAPHKISDLYYSYKQDL